jgi:class 3 adenylate cyclase/predicted ATPase
VIFRLVAVGPIAVHDIAAWLEGLGLGQYAEAFRANDITKGVLPELTDEDLKGLGLSLGHRRLLLKAIKSLSNPPDDVVAIDRPAPPSSPSPEPTPARPEAERRQLTVMFADLAGSTALAGRLDPEDMRAVITAYQNACSRMIGHYEGHVAKFMGDGVLAYFGYPRAHEDDAERAVRAGLELIDAVGRQSADGTRLAVRVGIATGQVVVGDLIGEGAAQEEAVVGETPNLAARLQNLAEPGSVVIGEATRRLVGGLFELANLGPRHLKGFEEPIAAWRVLRESRAESRFEALRGSRLTPLIGRDHELAILRDRWIWAKEGDGQVVLLSGEPGIGKSRLIQALREELTAEQYIALSHFCSPHHSNSALHPIIMYLERAAAFASDDGPEARLAKLEALLGQATKRLEEAVPLLAALLGIAAGDRYPALNLSPQRRKQRTLEALLEQLEGLARKKPVLTLYEDMQWVDPSTLELLEMVVERARALPVLVLITVRYEFSPPWTGQMHVTTLTMNRLGRRQGAAIVEGVAGGKALPAEILEQIVQRTDGIPLFVEELTKTVLESGLLQDAGDRYELAGPLPSRAIPATLHDSLMARLDRLASVKEVAQIAAVIGREFDHELLAAVAPLDTSELQGALDQLVAAELIFRRGKPPEATYWFKHGLVQDTAYSTLLKSRRHQLHARIAGILQERFPERAAAEPEIVAHHCTQAGLVDQAVSYWQQAGDLAKGRSAMTEAAVHFASAIELLSILPDTTERKRQELRLRTSQGAALIAAKGLAAPEVAGVYDRAHDLCAEVGDEQLLFAALCGQYWFRSQQGRLDKTLEIAQQVLSLAKKQEDPAPLLVGHRIVGTSLFHLGRLDEAQPQLECVQALYHPARHSFLASLYTFDPRVLSSLFLSWCLYCLGYCEQARARSDVCLRWAKEVSHPHTTAHALAGAATLSQLLRERGRVEEQSEKLVALASEQGFPFWLAIGRVLKGWAMAGAGDTTQGIAMLRSGLAAYQATGAELWAPYFLGLLAEACANTGQPDEGLSLVSEALAGVKESGARWSEAELHRLRAQLLLQAGMADVAEAEDSLRRAIAIAGAQMAKMWELRATTMLAGMWADQGKGREAHDLLAPVYSWFTEGFETSDLQDAKAVLDKLG